MSSSSPPLVPSLASCELRSSPSSSRSNGRAAAARVSHSLRKAAEDEQCRGNGRLQSGALDDGETTYSNQELRGDPSCIAGPGNIRLGGISRDSAGDRPPAALAPSSTAASALSLNPFAREFVPGSPISPPSSEGLMPTVDRAELATAIEPSSLDKSLPLENGNKRVSGITFERTDEERFQTSQRNDMRRSGGLSTAFKRGVQNGQSRTWAVSKGGSNGSSALPAAGKRGQFTNANHLLNFQYDPIVRPPPAPRSSYARKSHKVQPFNKELFLQANFRFLVSDFGDYLLNSLDPDKMLQWEDIAAVNISAPVPIQCPICLETPPVCPQITSCGHIFCFSCILRYLVLGDEEQRNDHFKKCPLCFAMTSSKALRTVFVDTVRKYQVGDTIEFTLLNRAKGSIIPFEKSDGVAGGYPYSKDGQCHSFSKFTLTSDADFTTNKAITELSNWAERAQKLADEDMDLIPFALLAIDQLQQRKSAWNDHRASEFLSSSPPVRQRILAQTKESSLNSSSQGVKSSTSENDNTEVTKGVSQRKQRGENVDIASETDAAMKDLKDKSGWVYEDAFSDDDGGVESSKVGSNKAKYDSEEQAEATPSVNIPLSWEETALESANSMDSVEDKDMQQAAKTEEEDNECYTFFQCADGQPLIIHPLNMKCLLQHCGSYENLPSRLHVRILEMEGQIQSEPLRKRYRYLSHLPLTTNFWFCEVDLRGVLPSSAFAPFIEELRYRETRRRRRQKQEQAEKLREERISAAQSRNSPPADFLPFIEDNDEEKEPSNLVADESGPEPVTASSGGPADQRKLFSQVTRLGFASAHDAPDLTPGKTAEPSEEKANSSSTGALTGKSPTMSFADIIQAQSSKTAPPVRNGANGSSQSNSSRKNKKATKVLLSTAGGRRY